MVIDSEAVEYAAAWCTFQLQLQNQKNLPEKVSYTFTIKIIP